MSTEGDLHGVGSKLQIGSLYTVSHSHCFLIAFPNHDLLSVAWIDGRYFSATSAPAAASLCKTILPGRYNKVGQQTEPYFYVNPKEPFLLLQAKYHHFWSWQVLCGERIGWVMVTQHSFIEPFVQSIAM